MSDEPSVLRTIDWRSVLPFTQIFRSFRVAIHPSKLMLAMTAIVLVYLAGRAMDAVWPAKYLAVRGEVRLYQESGGAGRFEDVLDNARRDERDTFNTLASEVAAEMRALNQTVPADGKLSPDQVKDGLAARLDRSVKAARESFEKTEKKTENIEQRDVLIRQAYAQRSRDWKAAQGIKGQSPFLALVDFQSQQITQIAAGVLRFDWLSPSGVLSGVYRFIFVGPGWALTHHPVYFVLLGGFALVVWSVFGGAIARIAAVQVARDEKISVRQALRFSLAKLLSFISAPLLPGMLIAGFALILAVAGWLTELPYVGSLAAIVIGLGFVVVIGLAVLLTCSMIGTVCGVGLMYPTIAVEGSDSFDAISRSFSYVFARPWKLAFYCVVAICYAALTYVFLRFVIYLALTLAHSYLNAWTTHNGPDGSTSLANIWVEPANMFTDLLPTPDYISMTTAEKAAALALSFWGYLFITLLGAYLLSLYVSVNTIFYFLLRYDVDATELDDVYLEPSDEELDEPMDEPARPAAAAITPPAQPTPPTTPPPAS